MLPQERSSRSWRPQGNHLLVKVDLLNLPPLLLELQHQVQDRRLNELQDNNPPPQVAGWIQFKSLGRTLKRGL
jgi:hypothetical protein